jgi:hypothetical protein
LREHSQGDIPDSIRFVPKIMFQRPQIIIRTDS